MTATATTSVISAKQRELLTTNEAALAAIGISLTDATKDKWRASGSLGRILQPKPEVLGALKALDARPFFARSSREAEMQLEVLKALQLKPTEAVAALAKYFKKLPA